MSPTICTESRHGWKAKKEVEMPVARTLLALAAILLIAAQACERNITFVEATDEPLSCFECHSDNNTFLVAAEQQWMNSFHASGLNIDRGASAGCAGCHISEGFIQRANGEQVTGEVNPTVIHCFTCHAPHSNRDFGLRWMEPATLLDGTSFDIGAGNLCVACHQARRDVNEFVGSGSDRTNINSTHWGPHYSIQGDMLLGSNGYEYDGYNYQSTPHRSATRDGCIDCHYRATSNNVVGGHAFNMRGDARDEGGEFSELLNVAACEPCHGDLDDFNYTGVQDEIDALIEELEGLVEAAGMWVNGHPNAGVITSADSAGAVWNLLMAEDDRSRGVHNPMYYKGLLQSSILFLEGTLSSPSAHADAGDRVAPSR
jgi:hypothetical protein